MIAESGGVLSWKEYPVRYIRRCRGGPWDSVAGSVPSGPALGIPALGSPVGGGLAGRACGAGGGKTGGGGSGWNGDSGSAAAGTPGENGAGGAGLAGGRGGTGGGAGIGGANCVGSSTVTLTSVGVVDQVIPEATSGAGSELAPAGPGGSTATPRTSSAMIEHTGTLRTTESADDRGNRGRRHRLMAQPPTSAPTPPAWCVHNGQSHCAQLQQKPQKSHRQQ